MSSAECVVDVWLYIHLVGVNRPNVCVEGFVVCVVSKLVQDIGIV